MRTTAIITPANGKHPGQRSLPQQHRAGRKKQQKATTAVREPVTGFLNAVFKPIQETDVNPLFRPGNYYYLYNSAKNCAGLFGKDFDLEPDTQNFEVICDKLDSLLPAGMEARLYEKDGKIHLKIINDLSDNLLYYIPCKIIDESEGEFRDILVEFFRLLQDGQKLTPLLDSQHFEMWQEEVETYEDDTGTRPDDEWVKLLKRYTGGDISDTLNLVNRKPVSDVSSLNARIKCYKPVCTGEKELLSCIRKGLGFLKTGKALLHYTNAPRLHSGDYPVDADNTFMVIYDDDMILDNLIRYMNDYACESGYEFFSSVNRTVTPRTKGIPGPDKFVDGFLKWINDLCYVLYNG